MASSELYLRSLTEQRCTAASSTDLVSALWRPRRSLEPMNYAAINDEQKFAARQWSSAGATCVLATGFGRRPPPTRLLARVWSSADKGLSRRLPSRSALLSVGTRRGLVAAALLLLARLHEGRSGGAPPRKRAKRAATHCLMSILQR